VGTERRERQKANRQLKQHEVAKQERRSHLTRRGIMIALAAGVIFVALVLIAVFVGNDDDNDNPPTTTVAATETTVSSETTGAAAAAGDTTEP
jgi:negative regulator of sigma E activity